jgi:hypothetical protein
LGEKLPQAVGVTTIYPPQVKQIVNGKPVVSKIEPLKIVNLKNLYAAGVEEGKIGKIGCAVIDLLAA